MDFYISDNAKRKIESLLIKEDIENLKLRVAVEGGGCSGFQYKFSFDRDVQSDDLVFGENGAQVLIDETSLALIAGTTLDYAEDLGSAGFVFKNPNATAKCGCGNSFSI
jgi:iron-sulfur cluster insertion protein